MNDKTILVRGFRLLSILHSMAELSRLYFQFLTFPTHGCLGAWSLCASRLSADSSTSFIHQVTRMARIALMYVFKVYWVPVVCSALLRVQEINNNFYSQETHSLVGDRQSCMILLCEYQWAVRKKLQRQQGMRSLKGEKKFTRLKGAERRRAPRENSTRAGSWESHCIQSEDVQGGKCRKWSHRKMRWGLWQAL